MRRNLGFLTCFALLTACSPPVSEVDPVDYCVEERYWLCRREAYAMRLAAPEAAACYAQIDADCADVSWPPGCAPTEAETDACIDVLSRGDLTPLTNDELLAMYDDCQICP